MAVGAATSAVFDFENILPQLDFLPIAARRALDHAGLRLSLEAWRSLGLDDRCQLVAAGADDLVDANAVSQVVRRAAPQAQRIEVVGDPDPLAPPDGLTRLLEPVPLDARQWARLRALDRYALAHVHRRSIARNDPTLIQAAYEDIVMGHLRSLRPPPGEAGGHSMGSTTPPPAVPPPPLLPRGDAARVARSYEMTPGPGRVQESPPVRTHDPARGRGQDTTPAPGRSHDAAPPLGRSYDATPPPGRSHDAAPPVGRNYDATPPPGRSHDAAPPVGRNYDATPPPGRSYDATPPPGRSYDATPPPGRSYDATPPPGRAAIDTPPSGGVYAPPSIGRRPREFSPRDDDQPPPARRRGAGISSIPPSEEPLFEGVSDIPELTPLAPGVLSTHLTAGGDAHMIDVGAKPITERRAIAAAVVTMQSDTFRRLAQRDTPKGDVLAAARIAGIQAAKRTSELIPLCHGIALTSVEVHLELDGNTYSVQITAIAQALDRTGVEMEALVAASIAGLTIYDMLKGIDRDMTLSDVRLLEKSGGRTGLWRRGDP